MNEWMNPIFLWLPLVGMVVGFMQGLIGVGGGVIAIPLFYWVLKSRGLPENLAMHAADATAMAMYTASALVIVPRHLRSHPKLMRSFLSLAPGLFFGVLLGTHVAVQLSARTIITLLVPILGLSAYWVVRPVDATRHSDRRQISGRILVPIGAAVGVLSGLMGLGGGLFLVPILLILGMELTAVVALSAINTLGVGLFGSAYYAWYAQRGLTTQLESMVGYVDVAILATMVVTMLPCAYLGARWLYRVPQKMLRQCIAMLIIGVACLLWWLH